MTDLDFDGFSNLNEYLSNTDPLNPDSYPDLTSPRATKKDEDWSDFILLLIILLIPAFIASIIIGALIIKHRKHDEEFWMDTFGDGYNDSAGMDYRSRDKYSEWRQRVVSETGPAQSKRHKYKLEIIGGPDSDTELDKRALYGVGSAYGPQSSKNKQKLDPKFMGRHCVWCDKGITTKYIKRCTEQLLNERRCKDGPFCSKKCLNEHLRTVPHYKKVKF
jgi:hypothetical protein